MPWWKWISPLPLDELSFLQFLRTIPLDREGAHQFNRHFDVTRNPTLVTVGAEEVVETFAGAFTTRVVIMHVRDPKHHKGVGPFKLNIELSSCRIPVRIVSRMPIVGDPTMRSPLSHLTISAAALLLVAATPAVPGRALTLRDGIRLWFDGTSTLRSGSCSADKIEVSLNAATDDVIEHTLDGRKVSGTVEVDFPAAQLECRNDTRNEHMGKALKMKEFSNGAAADGGNGQVLYTPLVGNLILDAFTTEVGAEAIFQQHGLLGVVALTNGEVRGQTLRASDRSPAFMAKLGFDKQLNDDLRTRLTGSFRNQGSAANGTLYSGDRAGSRYYYVLENTASTEAANFTSGMINPGFTDKVNAVMVNPFVRFRGGNRHA